LPSTFRAQGELVLFVDDEAAVREVARTVLTGLNFSVATASDGADALIQVSHHRNELYAIITDLHMPYMDGLAFVRALRRLLPAIPVIVMSGRLENHVALELEALGVRHTLDKPFTQNQMAEALRTALGRA
jgi:CheY-like chemotaxis protein